MLHVSWAQTAERGEDVATKNPVLVSVDIARLCDYFRLDGVQWTVITLGCYRSETEPSWASKLKAKMKNLLCFEVKGQYKAHVEAKKAHSRDKLVIRKIGLHVQSGSGDNITDEADWIKAHCPWTESEEEVSTASAESEGDDDEED
ncbi:hypothetical protein ZWY2020_004030 [Hordeum vulgare]|nr:hypothetical protein ZWY2020_004030 [Hordeum vulgare]